MVVVVVVVIHTNADNETEADSQKTKKITYKRDIELTNIERNQAGSVQGKCNNEKQTGSEHYDKQQPHTPQEYIRHSTISAV